LWFYGISGEDFAIGSFLQPMVDYTSNEILCSDHALYKSQILADTFYFNGVLFLKKMAMSAIKSRNLVIKL